ncbi:MAG: type II secretion system F family protein [Nanoarchaeota archaeon]|nr:type II secretion system F family protein [Nanoarchaeota archaeon]MBU1270259.1 type II secretion system F family protein [Nanoarchaeota archaeon]MBU1604843.1 type II secretion system F family protein [Nanoarchaeota archaeon]MBU2442487.1 type II secretion system F family protein [Nanoarchaeota archaeon]
MSWKITLNKLSLTSISKRLAHLFPDLKKNLWIARINKTPEEYTKEKLRLALMSGGTMAILTFFLVDKLNKSYFTILFSFIIFTAVFFFLFFKQVAAKVAVMEKQIDREVLFAGRFLLVKLNSGQPLINALVDASKSYGVANDYFKSIVRDIDMGTPLEEALDKAIKFTPSNRMKKILFQITNALKIGIDVTQTLEATLDQIAEEQLVEIQRYGKKLGSVTMFYMLGAVVLPSLGLTIFVIIASMMNIEVNFTLFGMILVLLVIIELIFLSVFKSIRPNVNI